MYVLVSAQLYPLLIGHFISSFFQAAISSEHEATLTWTEQSKRQRSSFRCFFNGSRFKCKVDLQDKVRVSCDKIVNY